MDKIGKPCTGSILVRTLMSNLNRELLLNGGSDEDDEESRDGDFDDNKSHHSKKSKA